MQMKANKLEVVKKQLPESWGVLNFNEEVEEHEAKFYHILEVKREHIQSEERYVTYAQVIKYNAETYHAQKDFFSRAGMKHVFILHDPEFKVAEVEEEKPKVSRGRKPKATEE